MIRVGAMGVAHLHAHSYAHLLGDRLSAVWDRNSERAAAFSSAHGAGIAASHEELFEGCEAAFICSENRFHADDIAAAAVAGKAILCEKPLATTDEEVERISNLLGLNFLAPHPRPLSPGGARGEPAFMTAFPCPYSPSFIAAEARIKNGEIGQILAVCATNHGCCPMGWFVEPELSGGGAIIDHTVHVADLLLRLFDQEPEQVRAFAGNNVHSLPVEDTAMLTLTYADNRFATIDASWSRPKSYKTWGDVKLNVVGTQGVIELDLFGQAFDYYGGETRDCQSVPFGSNLDALMLAEFFDCIETGREPRTSLEHGLAASRVAIEAARVAK